MKEAYALIYRTVVLQATTLAYIDTFLLLAVIAAIMFVLSFALRKNDPRRTQCCNGLSSETSFERTNHDSSHHH